jgi:hypothetical protein
MLRVTIRELLLLTAFIAIAFACLKYAEQMVWAVLATAVAALVMVTAVIAFVDRGRRQAIASGFVLCTVIYLVIVFTRVVAPDTWATKLLLDRLYPVMMRQIWIDRDTGQEVADPQSMVGGPPANVGGLQRPSLGHFQAIGHILWALLFGYLGSRFAAWIYARRQREPGATHARTDA